MRAEIISVGTELLLGDIVNTNAQFLAQELATLGFTVYYQSVVGDNPVRLRHLVQEAKDRSDVLVFTGGLGPTDDDLTKETVAEVYGDSLVLDEEELLRLEEYFARHGRTMAPGNRKQAMVPRRGRKLENPNGTAPGAYFRQGHKYAFLLPGPPREMKPMFENQVSPVLEGMQEGSIRSVTLRVIGIGESDLEETVRDLLSGSNPTAALYAKEGEVHIRITAKAATAEQADYMCAEAASLFEKVLGDYVYSDDERDLPTTIVEALSARGESVALAESCTGGLLAERITSVPGASEVFGYGAVSYANEFKRRMLGVRKGTLARYGAVSSQVAAEMAFGAAKKGGATYGVGVTGIAGPDGGSEEKPVGLVYVAVALGKQVYIRKLNIADRTRDYVRVLATQNALDMLRRAVLGLEIPGAKEFYSNQYADFERVGRPKRRGGILVRGLLAVVLVAVLFAGLMVGIYYLQRSNVIAKGVYPSAQGLHYGTPEYERAAINLVKKEKETNPAVTGFVSMPGALVEELVARGRSVQDELPKALDSPGVEGMAVMGTDASPLTASVNTVVAGGGALRPLLELVDTENAGEVSTFTYFTDEDAYEYRVFAAAYLDDQEDQPDDFDPAALKLGSYDDYLTFFLGSTGRSLYLTDVDVVESDTFMTLQTEDPAVPGRRFFLFGRQSRPGEDPVRGSAIPAGVPLMPQAYYEDAGLPQPDFNQQYERWMRRYLAGGMNNADLQLRAGMPEEDALPYIEVVEPEPVVTVTPVEETEAAQEPPPEEAAAPQQAQVTEEAPVSVAEAVQRSEREEVLFEEGTAASQEAGAAAAGSSAAESPPQASSSSAASASQGAAQNGGSSQASATSSSAAASSSLAEPEEEVQTTLLRPDARFLLVRMNGVLVRDTTTNVLAAICQSEVAGAPPEAIKAQAIAVHSWILNQQGGGNPAPSVRGDAPSLEVRDIVEEVSAMVLSADGESPAFTPWFGMSANTTNPAADLWGKPREYLTAVPTAEEEALEDHRQVFTVPYVEMAALVVDHLGLSPEDLGEAHNWLSEIEYNEGGYVVGVLVGEEKMSGLAFWQDFLVRNGVAILPSPAFEVEYSGEEFVFTVYGQGHGCGLSQAGAAQYAEKDGWDCGQILAHYYPGTEQLEWV